MTVPNEEDLDPRDKRASARADRRKDSLYEGLDEGERTRLKKVSPVRTSNYRWAPGEDPHDDDANQDSGYEYIKLDVREHQTADVDPYAGIRGQASGILCFECRVQDYLIIDERSAEEVIAGRDEESWAIKMNRPVDSWRVQGELLLFCPGCHAKTQMTEQMYVILKKQHEERKGP